MFTKASTITIYSNHSRNSKELNALRSQERQMSKLCEMIKSALNDVGCEELPSGCDDLSVEQSFIENNVSPDQPVSKILHFMFKYKEDYST